jgi:hypothetical protein
VHLGGVQCGSGMRFVHDCRQHALVLLEMAEKSPVSKERLLATAYSWLALAAIQDQLNVALDRAQRDSKTG